MLLTQQQQQILCVRGKVSNKHEQETPPGKGRGWWAETEHTPGSLFHQLLTHTRKATRQSAVSLNCSDATVDVSGGWAHLPLWAVPPPCPSAGVGSALPGNPQPCWLCTHLQQEQLLLWGPAQIAPPCYPGAVGTSRTCWQQLSQGSCPAPAWSCLGWHSFWHSPCPPWKGQSFPKLRFVLPSELGGRNEKTTVCFLLCFALPKTEQGAPWPGSSGVGKMQF